MSQEIKLGTVVKLKSGGPWMTVDNYAPYQPGFFVCLWFVGDQIKGGTFSAASLDIRIDEVN